MSNNFIQPSFAAGELSPTLYARVDLAKYHIGAAMMRNFFVDYRGGASTRPGTQYVNQCRISSKPVRLFPFQFNVEQTYILEFGDFYMRPITNGAPIVEAAVTITGVTQGANAVVTAPAHGYSSGDDVFIAGIVGMTELNNGTFNIYVLNANQFGINYLDGTPVDSTAFNAYVSGGTASRLYTLSTPYAAEDLALIKFTQSADVMTLCHPSYPPYDLSRLSNTNWTLTQVVIGSSISAPLNLTGTPSATGNTDYKYVVTAVGPNGDESVASAVEDVPTALDLNAVAGHIGLTWTVVGDAEYYNMYKAIPAVNGTVPAGAAFGFIGFTAGGNSFIDGNIVPDFVRTPPQDYNPFINNNPATVAYFQQRRVYAGSNSFPDTFWASHPGSFYNFDISNPIQDDDAIEATLASQQVNNIKHMITMPGGLILLTGGGVWQVSGAGGAGSPITPTSVQAQPQAYSGCSDVPPIAINYDVLYVQQRGAVVRDLSYSFYNNIYTSADISVMSNHLFFGYEVTEWAYAEEPFKLVWAVRNDGKLLSLTFLKEQEVFGWAQHDTLGLFKSVASISEGQEDSVYFVVERKIAGQWVKYIERMAQRLFTYGVEDAWCLDSALTNTLTYPAAGITIDLPAGTVVVTADAAIFGPDNVGDVIRAGGGIMTITAWTDSTHVTAQVTRPVQDVLADGRPAPVAEGNWSMTAPISSVSGLTHLEGEVVYALADGSVLGPFVVENGAIDLGHEVTKVIVGLLYTPKLQTLYLDTGEPTIQGKFKKISALTVRVTETRGLKMGSTFATLKEFKMRNNQPMGSPIALETGDQRIIMDNSWNSYGQICIEQDYPLPATVLGVVPEVTLGST